MSELLLRCRSCHKPYDPKNTADWRGYCSNPCINRMATKLGWSPKKEKRTSSLAYEKRITVFSVLNAHNEIGDVSADAARKKRELNYERRTNTFRQDGESDVDEVRHPAAL